MLAVIPPKLEYKQDHGWHSYCVTQSSFGAGRCGNLHPFLQRAIDRRGLDFDARAQEAS